MFRLAVITLVLLAANAVSSAAEGQTVLVFGSFTTVSAAAGWVRKSLQHEVDDAARINRT